MPTISDYREGHISKPNEAALDRIRNGIFPVAFAIVMLWVTTQVFAQRMLGAKRPCEELPGVLKRASEDCWIFCSAQTEAKEQLPLLIEQCNAVARAGAFEKSSCIAIQDYIRRVLKMSVPDGLTCQ